MTPQSNIPRPTGSSWTHTKRYLNDPFSLMMDAMEECGDVFALRLLGIGDWACICSPDTIRQLYKAPHDILTSSELSKSIFGFMFGHDSIAFFEGEPHKQRQQLIAPLLSGENALGHVGTIRSATERMIALWNTNKEISILPHLHELALQVIVRSLLGLGDKDYEKIDFLSKAYMRFTTKGVQSPLLAMPFTHINLGRFSPWGRVLHARDTARKIFREEITSRQKKGAGTLGSDILSTLIKMEGQSQNVSTDTALDEIFTLLFAGHETTSTTLAWTIERILSHPEVLKRIQQELDEELKGKPITRDHFPKLKYLDAVIQEGHRTSKRTPFTSLRLTRKPYVTNGTTIPKGKVIAVCHHAMCHREDTFPNPWNFDPGRFLRNESKGTEFSPFARGTRACVGRVFATVEMKIVLATLFQRAKLELPEPVTKAVRMGFMFGPEHGLRVRLNQL